MQNPHRRRAIEWHKALIKKKKAALEMLEAQKVIEDVESEAGEYVPKAELARLRSKFFDIQDSTSVDGRFIAAISGVAHNAQL